MTHQLNRRLNDSTNLAASLGNATSTAEVACDEKRYLDMTACYEVECCYWNETTASCWRTGHISCYHVKKYENYEIVLIGVVSSLLVCLLFCTVYCICSRNIMKIASR